MGDLIGDNVHNDGWGCGVCIKPHSFPNCHIAPMHNSSWKCWVVSWIPTGRP